MSKCAKTKPDGEESKPKKLRCLLRTFGCQMNVYDSQVAAGLLEREGFEVLQDSAEVEPDPAGCLSGGADIVIMNTCSVRDHAEQRVWGRLGRLGKEKKERPELIIALMGCMVEEHREKLFKRFPYLDLILGTRNISELPALVRRIQATRERVSRISRDGISIEYSEFTKRDSPYHAWLPIMTGCDKECTFCIVPKTRGREVSMPAEDVIREAKRLVADGVKWITLLGQNVNSYGAKERGVAGTDPGDVSLRTPDAVPLAGAQNVSFPQLLELLCAIDGLERLSFTTSHPGDATEELFQVIAKNPKISRRFHLPLQSGSDKILRRMKRLHTFADYKARVDRLRELVPGISVTTDIIVGFPGETEEDYLATKRAIEEIWFDSAFIYKYSVRPGTPAERLTDDVPFETKSRRNNELLAIQRSVTKAKNLERVGREVSGFVEARAPKGEQSFVARTDFDGRVIFACEKDLIGEFVRLTLDSVSHETFHGTLVPRGDA